MQKPVKDRLLDTFLLEARKQKVVDGSGFSAAVVTAT